MKLSTSVIDILTSALLPQSHDQTDQPGRKSHILIYVYIDAFVPEQICSVDYSEIEQNSTKTTMNSF